MSLTQALESWFLTGVVFGALLIVGDALRAYGPRRWRRRR